MGLAADDATDRVDQLIALTERLTDILRLDLRAFENRRPHEVAARAEEHGRLANLYRRLGRLDEALAASTRALSKVQGGRRLRVLSERADIHLARGEKDAAVSTLEEALAYAKTLSGAQASPRMVAALEKKLADTKAK